MSFSHHTVCRLAVVIRHFKILLLEESTYNVKGNLFNLNCKSCERMPEEMGLEDHRPRIVSTKNHAVEQEAHASGNGLAWQRLTIVLKQVRSHLKSMFTRVIRAVRNRWKRFPCLKIILFGKSPGDLDQQTLGFFANEVIM